MANEAHPAPWSHTSQQLRPRTVGEYQSCNVIYDAKGKPLMGDADYFPWIDLTPEEWKMVAASPQLLKVAQAFLSVMERFGNWDDGCFYYNGITASELQKPIEDAEAALVAAGVKFAS